jgi:hypothetical protein
VIALGYAERLGDHLRGYAHGPGERRVTIAFTVHEGGGTILRLACGGRDRAGLA